MKPLPPVQIHVLNPDDADDGVAFTDVGVVTINGERHLFLSPQSFDSAVRQVSSAMPDLPLEQVERLVREHCVEFKDFDELLGPVDSAPPVNVPPPPAAPPGPSRPRRRGKQWAVAATMVPALMAGWALGHYGNSAPVATPDAANTNLPKADNAQEATAQPFADPMFRGFSDAGSIDCKTIDALEAECTDADGMVMSSKAATGPDSTIFTFSYGTERLGLRIFHDRDYAATWVRQDGTTELYPNLVRLGRYVLWGTDEKRLKEYQELLSSSTVATHTMSYASPAPTVPAPKLPVSDHLPAPAPLPPRLAALTLGTLGLDEREVREILAAPEHSPVGVPVLFAARMVLGMSEDNGARQGGHDDIVAIAAGIEPSPIVTVPDIVPDPPTPSEAVVPVSSSGSATSPEPADDNTEPAAEPTKENPAVSTPQAQQPEPVEEPENTSHPEPEPEQAGTDEPSGASAEDHPSAGTDAGPADPAEEVPVPALPVQEATSGDLGLRPTDVPSDAGAAHGFLDDAHGILSLPHAWVAPAARPAMEQPAHAA